MAVLKFMRIRAAGVPSQIGAILIVALKLGSFQYDSVMGRCAFVGKSYARSTLLRDPARNAADRLSLRCSNGEPPGAHSAFCSPSASAT